MEFSPWFNFFAGPPRCMDAEERKATVLEKMARRNQWGMNYRPVETTLSNIPERFRREARRDLEALIQAGWVERHKNGACVSLSSARKGDIRGFLEEHGGLEDWLLDHLFGSQK